MDLVETALPRRCQGGTNLGGMMSVVIDYAHPVSAANYLEAAIYASQRKQWGNRIDSYPLVRETLVDMLVDLEAGMAATYECAAAAKSTIDIQGGCLH